MPSKDKVRELALLPQVKELQSRLRATSSSLRGRCERDWNQTLWEFGPRNEAYRVPGCASSPTCSRRLGWRCFVIRASLILWGAHSDLRAECATAVYRCGLEANKTWSGEPECGFVLMSSEWLIPWGGGREGGMDGEHLGCHCMAKSPTTPAFGLATCTSLMWLWLWWVYYCILLKTGLWWAFWG